MAELDLEVFDLMVKWTPEDEARPDVNVGEIPAALSERAHRVLRTNARLRGVFDGSLPVNGDSSDSGRAYYLAIVAGQCGLDQADAARLVCDFYAQPGKKRLHRVKLEKTLRGWVKGREEAEQEYTTAPRMDDPEEDRCAAEVSPLETAEPARTTPRTDDRSPTRKAEPTSTPDLTVPDAGMIGVGRDFADLYGQYLESPRSFFYFSFLAYFGALVAKMVTLESELRPEPRLYVVVLGESADTRKSTALRKADHFFKLLGPEWTPAVLLGVGSAEGLAAALKDQPDHSLLLHLDEAKSFVDKARAESSVLLPMVTSLFERDSYDNRTKDGSVSVRGVSLSLLGACTRDTYSTMFDPRFFSIGFLNRLFLVADHTTVKIPIPHPVPANALEALRVEVAECLHGIRAAYHRNNYQPVPYEMTPGAVELYRAWYEARTGSVFERRLDTYGHRLMVLLAATTGRAEVDEDVMTAVLALLKYQLETRLECDPVDADNAVATLEERIRRTLARGPMKGRDLKKKLHIERCGVWMWQTASQNLLKARELRWDQKRDIYHLTDGPIPTFVPTPMGTLK